MEYTEVLKSRGIDATFSTEKVAECAVYQHTKRNAVGDVIVDRDGSPIKWTTVKVNGHELSQLVLRRCIDNGNCEQLNKLLDGYELSQYSARSRNKSGDLLILMLKEATVSVASFKVEEGDTVVLLDREYERSAEGSAEYEVPYALNFSARHCAKVADIVRRHEDELFMQFV